MLERGQPDSGALRTPRRRAGDPRGAGRRYRRAAADAAGREPPAVRRRRGPGDHDCPANGLGAGAICCAVFDPRARRDGRRHPVVGWCDAGGHRRRAPRVRAASAVGRAGRGAGGRGHPVGRRRHGPVVDQQAFPGDREQARPDRHGRR